jgi:hypothetical protein
MEPPPDWTRPLFDILLPYVLSKQGDIKAKEKERIREAEADLLLGSKALAGFPRILADYRSQSAEQRRALEREYLVRRSYTAAPPRLADMPNPFDIIIDGHAPIRRRTTTLTPEMALPAVPPAALGPTLVTDAYGRTYLQVAGPYAGVFTGVGVPPPGPVIPAASTEASKQAAAAEVARLTGIPRPYVYGSPVAPQRQYFGATPRAPSSSSANYAPDLGARGYQYA